MPMPDDPKFGLVYTRVIDRWIAAGTHTTLTADEQGFISITTLLNENSNGALWQYFYNSYSEFAPRATATLVRLNCHAAASTLRQAMALFGPDAFPADRSKRQALLDTFTSISEEALSLLSEDLERAEPRIWAALVTASATWDLP
jgi:hypothetical protein